MEWADERFIKLYTRDTGEMLLLSWQARCLFWELQRKVDLGGRIKLKKRHPARALAVVLRVPVEVAESCLEEWLGEDGEDALVALCDGVLTIPSFIAAQTAKQSDAARKRRQRERDVIEAAVREEVAQEMRVSRNVTPESRNVTDGHDTGQNVTRCHTASRDVTTRLEETRRDETRGDLSLFPEEPTDGGQGGTQPPPAAAGSSPQKSKSATTRCRISDDWQPAGSTRSWALDPDGGKEGTGPKLSERELVELVPAFRDHHIAKSGKDSLKTARGWEAAFRTWCRNHRKGYGAPRNGHGGSRAGDAGMAPGTYQQAQPDEDNLPWRKAAI